jgi:thiol-disulfide isomerase/thioredoxin
VVAQRTKNTEEKNLMKRIVLLALFCLLSAQGAMAAALGDAAAPLAVAEWIKGEPVIISEGKGDTIYVVEFWATWCPPCLVSIPHLTELQKKYKDKNVIFVSVTNEDPQVVRPFVTARGDGMDYRIAIDKNNGTSRGYMSAFGQNGIPMAFIVDKEGRVAWVGSPMAGLDEALEQVVAGTYDIEAVARESALEQVRQNLYMAFNMGVVQGDWEGVQAVANVMMKDHASEYVLLGSSAWLLVGRPELPEEQQPLALELAEKAVAGMNKEEQTDSQFYHVLARALYISGDSEGAIKNERKAIDIETEPGLIDLYKTALQEFEGGESLAAEPSGA